MEEEPNFMDAPDWIKSLDWMYQYVRRYWRLIVKAPVVITIFLAAYGGYLFGEKNGADRLVSSDDRLKSKDEQIRTKDGSIEFLGQQLAAYRERLQGATPDEAAKRILGLEESIKRQAQRLNVIAPENYRHLTEDQRSKLTLHIDELKKALPKGGSLMLSTEPIGDSPNYAEEIVRFLNSKSPGLIAGPFTGVCGEKERGVSYAVPDPRSPSMNTATIFLILKESGFNPRYTQAESEVGDGAIFICRVE